MIFLYRGSTVTAPKDHAPQPGDGLKRREGHRGFHRNFPSWAWCGWDGPAGYKRRARLAN